MNQVSKFLTAAFALGLISFGLLADEVRDGDTLAFDELVLNTIRQSASSSLDAFFNFVTFFGGTIAVAIFSLLLIGYCFYRRRRRYAFFLMSAMGGISLLIVFLKLLFARTRPDLWEQIAVETSFSFPSGHATASSALALTVVVIAWRSKWRKLIIGLGIIYVLVIGFSRLYLGVHYPTDIVAGWTISIVWLSALTVLWNSRFVRVKKTTEH